MTGTKLTQRQENLLATSLSLSLASFQMPDRYVRDWFQRVLKGSRTPEPAEESELAELWRLVQLSRSIEIEEGPAT